MFTQGEIIVWDDLKYPDGAVVVDGLDSRGHLLVHPVGGGLQFALPPREVSRFQSMEPAEQILVFSAATFYLEGIAGICRLGTTGRSPASPGRLHSGFWDVEPAPTSS